MIPKIINEYNVIKFSAWVKFNISLPYHESAFRSDDKIIDLSNLKVIADDKLIVTQTMRCCS